MRLFIFGVGYSSKAFVERCSKSFDWIGGTTRSEEKFGQLRADGIEPFLFDGTQPGKGIQSALSATTHVLISIPPGEAGDPVLRYHAKELSYAKPHWLAYLSTVGVYGNHDGAWVTEDTPLNPVSKRSFQRIDAEENWRRFCEEQHLRLQIFRLSGIYGPARNAFENLKKGKARRLIKPGQVFNRIHVDDLAGALEAAMHFTESRTFNVTDDEPAPPQDVVTFAADLLGIDPPVEVSFETADLTPMARSFYGENKRVSNARVKQELGYRFQYPNYRVALRSLLSTL